MFFKTGTVAVFAAMLSPAALVAAQQSVWGQCGGIGWSGSTTCVSGSMCTELNSYYFQCLPGSASSSSSPTSTSAVGAPSSTSSSTADGSNFWFSFGDSYTQTDFDPNGTLPSVGNPLGNPPYPGYTAVGGTNWIDLMTVEFNKSLILTYNYAYGGATIDASLVAPYEPTVLSMTDQVNEFLAGAATKPAMAPWTSDNALFSFWIGINDIGNSYYLSGDRDAAVGGRNFLFIYVPPIDRSPLMLAQSTSAQALEKTVIAGYNTKLSEGAIQLKANHSDSQTWVWDSNAVFTQILDDPGAFGFVDATSYGGTGDFWGNNYHPSSEAHTIFAQNVSTVLSDTVW